MIPVVTNLLATRCLHVANGTCTTRLIESAGIPGALSIWADPLYEGPVPDGLTDTELLRVRARYLADSKGGADVDPVNDLRLWRETIRRHDSYDELILWFEHDLFDQLNLVQVLTWIHDCLPAATTVSLVCVGSFPGHPGFKGLGQLTPGELASLLETRQRVGEAQYSLAERTWEAFRKPTPEALDRLRHTNTAAMPYLSAAITRFLQEFPWTTDGLSLTERRLLQLAAPGGTTLSTAFPRMHQDEDAYYVTDLSLMSLAHALSQTSPPLLAFASRQSADDDPFHESVRLTDTGRAIIEGRQDRVATCGIDRWLGGVHLQGHSAVWRWDDLHQTMTTSLSATPRR
jgi:hypothetical protein